MEDKLTDFEIRTYKSLMSRKWKRWLLSLLIFITISCLVIAYLSYKVKFNGNSLAALQMLLGAGAICLFIIPVTGMLIASLLSLVPIKGYEYSKKYWAFALVTILVLQSIILLGISASYVYGPARKIENTSSGQK